MSGKATQIAVAVGTAVVTFVLITMATVGFGAAPQQTELPKGPYIDFCPTHEQIETHLEQYGFDYKPTVACTEDGEELAPSNNGGEESVTEEELFAAEKEALLTATRAPDTDGDPLTMEIVLADGTKTTIYIDGNPEFFKGMTPAEYAKMIYP